MWVITGSLVWVITGSLVWAISEALTWVVFWPGVNSGSLVWSVSGWCYLFMWMLCCLCCGLSLKV